MTNRRTTKAKATKAPQWKKGSLTEKVVDVLSKDKKAKWTYPQLSKKLKVNTGALGFAMKQLAAKKGYATMAKRVVSSK